MSDSETILYNKNKEKKFLQARKRLYKPLIRENKQEPQ